MNKFYKAVSEAMDEISDEFTSRPVPFHALGAGLVNALYDELNADEPGQYTKRDTCPVGLHAANQDLICKLWKASRKKHGFPVTESTDEKQIKCENCNGKGSTEETCDSCSGSGEGSSEKSRCSSCKGSGCEICECPDCEGTGIQKTQEDN